MGKVCDKNVNDIKEVSIQLLGQDNTYKVKTFEPDDDPRCIKFKHDLNTNDLEPNKYRFEVIATDKSNKSSNREIKIFEIKASPEPS